MSKSSELSEFSGYLQNGCGLIAAERDRQIRELNHTSERDDLYAGEELRDAAIAYAIVCDDRADNPPSCWPFDPVSFAYSASKARNLVKSGALIAAELDRYHREFQRACNALTLERYGFECFDERDDYDLAKLPWVGVDPEAFVDQSFSRTCAALTEEVEDGEDN